MSTHSATLKDATLSSEIPYWEFFNDPFPHVLLLDGSVCSGMDVSLRDIECLDDASVNQLTGGIRSLLNSIPEKSFVQFQVSIGSDFSQTLSKHETSVDSDTHPLLQAIAKKRIRRIREEIEEGSLFKPKLTVYVRTEAVKTKNAGLLLALKKIEAFTKVHTDAHQETLEQLSQTLDVMTSGFQSIGISVTPHEREKQIERIYQALNPRRSKTIPPPDILEDQNPELDPAVLKDNPWLSLQSPRSQLVFGDLILGFEQFTLDGMYHRVITLKTLPEITYAGQLASFLRMPYHYDLSLTFKVPEQADEMAKLNQKRKMAHSLAVTQGGKVSDLESETKLSSTEELIRELLVTGQRIFEAQMVITLKDRADKDGEKRLNRKVRDVVSRFRALSGAEALEETVGAWKIAKGVLPFAPIRLERGKNFKSNNLADFIPIFGPREGDEDPVVLFKNRLGGLVSYDPMDVKLPNYNCLVTGSSGAGKSFLNNCILLQELGRKQRVFIIDIEGSYKKLTEALGGQYLDVNLSDAYRINPFWIPDWNTEPDSKKIKSLLAVIECMVSEDNQARLPKLTRVLLEKSIIELYSEKRHLGVLPKLSDLESMLGRSSEPELRAISKMLYMWTGDRPYGKLLDGDGSLSTSSKICTFDLKGLSSYPDLQSVMILILTDFILTQVESDKIHRKRIILDEAWELLKSPSAANFMEYCARTLRKSGSGITFITQGVEEIVSSPIGSAILNNTATKFVLLQRGDSKLLADTLKLNDQELSLIQSLEQRKGQYSEGFLIEGDHRQVIRITPGAYEYWLSTSDAKDNAYLEEKVKSGMSLQQAISTAVSEYPEGRSRPQSNQIPTPEKGGI